MPLALNVTQAFRPAAASAPHASHAHSSYLYPHHDYYQILRPSTSINDLCAAAFVRLPMAHPSSPRPPSPYVGGVLTGSVHISTLPFHQPLSSRSPTKRHVHDFISWLLFGSWIPGPHRGLDRSIWHSPRNIEQRWNWFHSGVNGRRRYPRLQLWARAHMYIV